MKVKETARYKKARRGRKFQQSHQIKRWVKSKISSRPSSACSAQSVICLGSYKKIPPLISLEDGSDDENPSDSYDYERKLQNCFPNSYNSFDNVEMTDHLNTVEAPHS